MNGEAKKTPKFDLLMAAAAFARESGVALNDPTLITQFLAAAGGTLTAALQSHTLVHGKRVENLFEAMVVSLGGYSLLKVEDLGRVHAPRHLRAPDFRVVLKDGRQWLVEVKNVRCKDPKRQRTKLSAAYMRTLDDYAALVGAPLYLAIYWSLWKIWTLVPPARFRMPGGGVHISMEGAMMANALGCLGDVSLNTVAPLRLMFAGTQEEPLMLDGEGLPENRVPVAKIFSRNVELIDPKDRQLAMVLMQYGEWPISGPNPVPNDPAGAVEFIAEPVEPSDEGYDGIGTASRIFSRYFSSQTIAGDQVIQLHGAPVPQWFAPIASWDFKGSRLPLWVFRMQPKVDEPASSDSVLDPPQPTSAGTPGRIIQESPSRK
ncbi:hypothetical protein [Sphingobium aquiterrae]|uniref:hypothetical protein n=1 Tax=Sphingobium aquiterrae TaxID=2038656 RepID=UPI00301AC043